MLKREYTPLQQTIRDHFTVAYNVVIQRTPPKTDEDWEVVMDTLKNLYAKCTHDLDESVNHDL